MHRPGKKPTVNTKSMQYANISGAKVEFITMLYSDTKNKLREINICELGKGFDHGSSIKASFFEFI